MRESRVQRSLKIAVAWALAGVTALASGGCFLFVDQAEKARELAPEIRVGSEREDYLHCARDRCDQWYRLIVDAPETVILEANAPAHPSLPDFSLTLQSRELNLVGQDSEPQERPRRIRKNLQPGIYFVHLASINEHDDRLSYRLSVESERPQPPPRPKRPQVPIVQPKPKRDGPPPPPPKPAFLLETAIIEVEREGGEPVAVLLEAGTGTGIERGMRGELLDTGRSIGEIEVIGVYAQGSRARIVGALSAPITYDTKARLRR